MNKYQFMKDTDENGKEIVSVSHRPRRRLNIFALLLSLLVAVGIWLWIFNFNQTDVTETVVLKIEYVGLDALEKEGMMIYGMDQTELTVTIKGSNSDVKKYKRPGAYTVVADVSGITKAGEYTIPLTVNTPADSKVTIETAQSLNVSLICDLSAEKEINIGLSAVNTQDNMFVSYTYQYEQSDNTIVVKGPKKIIDTIESARFDANVNFVLNEDEKTYSDFPLVFLDTNLNEVDDKDAVEYSTKDMTVKVTAVAHKSVPIDVMIEGASNNDLTYQKDMNTVILSGVPSVVREINGYTLIIKKSELAATITRALTNDVLPDGAYVEGVQVITVTITNWEEISADNE